ncbi:MAG: nuclear transport factor 2 family protein [Gemmatimonadales bacterium]|jgi:ketosteroid isomerase-like protein
MTKGQISQLFQAIDARDADAFASFLSENAVFRYGSQPAVQGKEAIRGYVSGFFGTLQALRHQVIDTWEREDSMVCQGIVTYTREDGSDVSVPFTNIFRFEGELIRDYLVYIDPTPLAG